MEHTNKSIWITGKQKEYYRFSGDIEVDVAIVGGGITGITSAYLLAKAGKSVAVLESCSIAKGTTGHSTGNLYVPVDARLHHLREKYDQEKVNQVLQSRTEAIQLIREIVAAEGIECALRDAPWVLLAQDDEHTETVQKEYESLKDAGLPAKLTTELNLPVPVKQAVVLEGQAQFDPYAYTTALAQIAAKLGVKIFENSPVTDWDEKDDHVLIQSTTGKVKAGQMIMATHTPKGINLIQTLLGPYREFGLAAATNGPAVPDGTYWVAGKVRHHSLRNHRADGKDYLIVITEHFKTGQKEDTRAALQSGTDFLKSCGHEAVSHSWGAQHYRPADELPLIGKGSDRSRIFYGTGYSTDGLTYGTLAAMIITGEITGRPSQWADTYRYNRVNPAKSAGNFLKENLNVAGQYIKDLVLPKEELESLKPGEGKVIKHDGSSVAAYRKEDGSIQCVSAICTHMKCEVNFNHAEKSWDCPCHGSRFTTDGSVIEGPAISPLATADIKTTTKN